MNNLTFDVLKQRINFLFREVLEKVEKETNHFGIRKDFFEKKRNGDGFSGIRKVLLDRGNDILKLLEILFSENEMILKKSIIEITEQLRREIKNDSSKTDTNI